MGLLPEFISAHHMLAIAWGGQMRVTDPLELVTDNCELLSGCWELDLGHLEEQLFCHLSGP